MSPVQMAPPAVCYLGDTKRGGCGKVGSGQQGNYYSRVTFHIKMIYTSHLRWSAHFLSNFMPLLELLNSLLMIIHHTTLERNIFSFILQCWSAGTSIICGMVVWVPYWKVGLILFHTPGIKYNYSDKVINYHPVSGLSHGQRIVIDTHDKLNVFSLVLQKVPSEGS